jgi:hypothetical protein
MAQAEETFNRRPKFSPSLLKILSVKLDVSSNFLLRKASTVSNSSSSIAYSPSSRPLTDIL